MSEHHTLFYDIETSPIRGYTWGKYEQNVVWIEEDWQILSVAWKWAGEKRVHVVGQDDFHDFGALYPGGDLEVVEVIRGLFEEAELVVAHNGNRFDQPKSRARMLYHGMEVPPRPKEVDTLQMAKRVGSFTSNKLDDLCQHFGIGRKVHNGGIETWIGCMAGDPKAWALMKRYNRYDVTLLEKLYRKLLQAAPNHPNMATILDRPTACPRCGEEGHMIVRGHRYFTVTYRVQYQCTACGGYCAGRKIEKSEALYTL